MACILCPIHAISSPFWLCKKSGCRCFFCHRDKNLPWEPRGLFHEWCMFDGAWSNHIGQGGTDKCAALDDFITHASFSFLFVSGSYPAVCEFLQHNNLLSILRAHEAQDAGWAALWVSGNHAECLGHSFLTVLRLERAPFARLSPWSN